jgi:hypothetical protein
MERRDELLAACGGEVAPRPSSVVRTIMAVVCKDVRFGSRVFRLGDIVTNCDLSHGIKQARLAVFGGGRLGVDGHSEQESAHELA